MASIYLNHNHRHLEAQTHFQEHQMHVPRKVMIVVVYPFDEDHLPIWSKLHPVPIQQKKFVLSNGTLYTTRDNTLLMTNVKS